MPFTQAQGGGKKGASTCDHLFILRAIIDISIAQKRETYITFYDVSKAYDNADNNDMLSIMWDKGLKGKAWRILQNLSRNLKAVVKTRFGQTRQIDMEIGGKQGSRLTGRLFAKLMDVLSEELISTNEGFKITNEFLVAVLLWVDDVVSCVEGPENQEKMLKRIHEFAVKHKLKWGSSKCKIMKVGRHKKGEDKWSLGDQVIQESSVYKYLGDEISNDGKNKKNINARKNKLTATTVTINTIATNEILNKIETSILLELHEQISIPGFLTNSESWNLNKGEKDELEKIEVEALKDLFDLPIHTPTPAIIYTFGTLFTRIRIDQKQLIYLHKVLNQDKTHWTRKTLETLENLNLGWAKSIKETLTEYKLPTSYETIRTTPSIAWKNQVKTQIEIKNTERLKNECYKNVNGDLQPKTKTKTIINHIAEHHYKRAPKTEIIKCSKQDTKTLIMARYGMLECGYNYKGTLKVTCDLCNLEDNENHRLNHCIKYRDINLYDHLEKVPFETIYSGELTILRKVLPTIQLVWNTKSANGTMNLK